MIYVRNRQMYYVPELFDIAQLLFIYLVILQILVYIVVKNRQWQIIKTYLFLKKCSNLFNSTKTDINIVNKNKVIIIKK